MKEIIDIVLSYPKLAELIQNDSAKKESAIKMIHEICGEFNPTVVGSAAKFIDSTFMKLYEGVNLDVSKNFDLKKLVKENHVVFVPNHQSHADYIALTYLLFKNFQLPVYVAAGINLNFFPVGKLFRSSGAFFLRRKFNNDQIYKNTFEGYIYYLLKTHKPVEFFFEGGRTRTGKLMSPRFGLFTMLIEAHQHIENKKPLLFVPVAIAHEHIPEEKAHAKEMRGGAKEAEHTTQLLKIFKLFSKKLGTIHVRIADPIKAPEQFNDLKQQTQDLAFECFKAVGREMPVTPSSLLALTMLDEPSGALTWKQIEERCIDVIEFCKRFQIPVTSSLELNIARESLRRSLDLFINNKKVDVLSSEKLNQVFYTIKKDTRIEILYHKNMILHHFLVPGIINATWFNIFNGNIKTPSELAKFLMVKRKELKYEFYLPSIKEMIHFALKISSHAVNKEMKSLDEALHFSSQELYSVAQSVRRFSTAFSYIYEAYYLACTSIRYLKNSRFNQETFIQVAKELYQIEFEHGRVIKYPESFNVPMMKDSINYLVNLKVIMEHDGGTYSVADENKLDILIEKFARDLNDQVSINLKFNR